ncbi:DUF2958 domain-containing protein [Mesorhizobium sp. BR1-1-9]|nr:DUF2958 domain-containing protein [Mesorhizobium sp. BR1-1-9]MBZ9942172.1 DUF2958 domain-containing protein [Mesorhizobium sp. BR1-1-13]
MDIFIHRQARRRDEDRDPCWALANLGKPELGSVVIVDITAVRLPAGLGMEPDVRGSCFSSASGGEPAMGAAASPREPGGHVMRFHR